MGICLRPGSVRVGSADSRFAKGRAVPGSAMPGSILLKAHSSDFTLLNNIHAAKRGFCSLTTPRALIQRKLTQIGGKGARERECRGKTVRGKGGCECSGAPSFPFGLSLCHSLKQLDKTHFQFAEKKYSDFCVQTIPRFNQKRIITRTYTLILCRFFSDGFHYWAREASVRG